MRYRQRQAKREVEASIELGNKGVHGMSEEDDAKEQLNWPLLIGTILVLAIGGMLGVRSWLKSRDVENLRICTANLKTVVTAAKMYAKDHKGSYPKSLGDLTQARYLEALPTCPVAKAMTFTDYTARVKPDRMEVSCCGGHHYKLFEGSGVSTRFPHIEEGPVKPKKLGPPPKKKK